MLGQRDLAQPGRALALGARCRRFESYSPDQLKKTAFVLSFLFLAEQLEKLY